MFVLVLILLSVLPYHALHASGKHTFNEAPSLTLCAAGGTTAVVKMAGGKRLFKCHS